MNEKRTSPAGTPAKEETWEPEKRRLCDETREAQVLGFAVLALASNQ